METKKEGTATISLREYESLKRAAEAVLKRKSIFYSYGCYYYIVGCKENEALISRIEELAKENYDLEKKIKELSPKKKRGIFGI